MSYMYGSLWILKQVPLGHVCVNFLSIQPTYLFFILGKGHGIGWSQPSNQSHCSTTSLI